MQQELAGSSPMSLPIFRPRASVRVYVSSTHKGFLSADDDRRAYSIDGCPSKQIRIAMPTGRSITQYK